MSESRFFVERSVYARPFGERETVLLDFGRGEYFGLDEVGAAVWRELEAGRSLGAIADRMVERFEVARDQALRDVIELVTELCETGLVRAVPAGDPR